MSDAPQFIPDDEATPSDPAPPPQTQSEFVNPALARVAAVRPRPTPRPISELWLGLRTVILILSAAIITAFIFSYWTPNSFLSEEFVANLRVVSATQGPPTALPSPLPTYSLTQTIGILIGHSGPPLNPQFSEDPGAICDENGDGVPELRELDFNTAVGLRVADLLIEAGYAVELLNEWDARLENYRASALVSIHTNTCENLGFGATGYNVKANERSPMLERDLVLEDCVAATYAANTGLPRHYGSPPDLVDYHAFRKVSLDTPTIIVELGFMFSDRAVLMQNNEGMARGIFQGLECFLRPEVRASILTTPAPSSP
jgi:N-acetylmuramoyl-L-alanine amidase